MSEVHGELFGSAPAAASYLGRSRVRSRGFLAGVLRPPPPVDLNQWAERHLVLGSESPFPGRYDPARFPFFHAVLAALGPEDASRIITLLGSAQIGKTLIAQIFVAASLDLDPGGVLYVHPTESNAIRFARTKWRPLIRTTGRLGEIFEPRQSKEGGNSTLFQQRRDGRGSLLIGGASSEASLSMITVKRQVQDDLSKWEVNTAGDPEAQADSRSKAFEEAKILKLGTGLLKANCRTTRAFLAGTQNYFHVPCPHCEVFQVLDPDNFIANAKPDDPAAAHFTCTACGAVIRETDRRGMVARGRWVAHNPGAADTSFTIWAAYAPLESWERIARSYFAALGDPATEQTWWNDTAGRAYELPGEAPSWEGLKHRAEAAGRLLGQVPPAALILTLSLDCQDDYVDGMVAGWGPDLRRWVVARVRVEGHISTPETRAELNRLVDFEWPTWCGTRRRVDLAGIDAGAWTDDVFEWAKGWPKSRVIMLRGVGGDTAPSLNLVRRERRRDGRVVKYQGRFFNVGVSGLKGGLYKFLRIENPTARGFVDFPAGLDDDYYEQLTAEKRTPMIDGRGFTFYAWVKPRGLRNEQLDLMVYGEALARKLGWRVISDQRWAQLAKEREPEGAPAATEHAAREFWGEERTVTPPNEPPPPPPQSTIPAAAVQPAKPAAPWPVSRPNFRRRY
jgi:phage terminase large subunit GpA-like protein